MKSHIRLLIDSVLKFEGDLNEWTSEPPEFVKDSMKLGAKPEPWMKAILIVMADAAMSGDNVSIEAWTPSPDQPNRWALEVITNDG